MKPPGLKASLARLAGGAILSAGEAEAVFAAIMDGEATDVQIAAVLTAMHLRGETTPELQGALRALRGRMICVEAPPGAIDVCGTGGDGLGTLNISTATAFVVAACGVPVAKHGNRALSSRAGGADVLTALGVGLDLDAASLAGVLARCGLVFLFAPHHHAALRHAGRARAELGFRTAFNLLGPMANPARVRRQLVGVYDPAWIVPIAETLGALGSERVWAVHGQGLDELSLAGPTHVAEWDGGRVRTFTVSPGDAGLDAAAVEAIRGGDAAENAAALLALLEGAHGAYRDTVLYNGAAALIVAGVETDLRSGVVRCRETLDGGAALAVLEALRRETHAAATPIAWE